MSTTQDPGPQSFTPINMFAMLRALINNNVPILPINGTPTNGTSGSFVGQAGPGSILLDYTGGGMYRNIGTLLSPIWKSAGAVGGNAGLGEINCIKFTYDFAVDGGVVGVIVPSNAPILAAKAIILGGAIDITTALTSGGSATIALGFGAGATAASLKAATAVASWTLGFAFDLIPVWTAATYIKMTALGVPQLTVAAAALTAGKFDVNLAYVIGN